jgi:aquaporin Z
MAATILVEFIGTFFLVLAAMLASGPAASFAVVAVLTAMIYAGGRISGAHYNPCVTFANWLRGACPPRQAAAYVAAQLAAACSAVAAASVLMRGQSVGVLRCDLAACVGAEFLFTFAMVYVIIHVAAGRGVEGNQYYGVAIGLVVLGAGLLVGPISGALLNPAVVLAKVLEGVVPRETAFVWIVPQFFGAGCATMAFRATDSRR